MFFAERDRVNINVSTNNLMYMGTAWISYRGSKD